MFVELYCKFLFVFVVTMLPEAQGTSTAMEVQL